MAKLFSTLLLLVLVASFVIAQNTASVPDVTNMTLPEAAAALNRAGFLLGNATTEEWTSGSGQQAHTVSQQQPSAGTSLNRGEAIDVTVLHPFTVTIAYDDNDITVINQADDPLFVHNLMFNSLSNNTSFAGTRWTGDASISPDRCAQIWSVGGIGAAKDVPGCGGFRFTRWLSTQNANEHFWTDGSTEFEVVQDGLVRGRCDTSNVAPGASQNCSLYLSPGAISEDVMEYVYLTYNKDYLLVINRSEDRWLPTDTMTLNRNFIPGDPDLFSDQEVIGDVGLLAPGQCLLFSVQSPTPESAPPESCDVIARSALPNSSVFWDEAFAVSGGSNRQCAAAVAEQKSICLLPR